jgi:hypothetical protein
MEALKVAKRQRLKLPEPLLLNLLLKPWMTWRLAKARR